MHSLPQVSLGVISGHEINRLSSKMHNSKIFSGNVKTFAVISFWVVHEGLTLERVDILLVHLLHNFVVLITLKGFLLRLCEQKCYFSLNEKGSRVMLKCEPTVSQVHVPSRQSECCTAEGMGTRPMPGHPLTQKTASLAELPPRCLSVAAERMCIHALS